MQHAKWMIYGANGYTGRLIAQEAHRRGLTPILAGRNGEAISRLGNRLNLETRVFALDRSDPVAEKLSDVKVVLHCAGPFSATSAPMLEGCKRAGTHYLDITGEIDVFETCHARHVEWVESNITVIPGVGMDVVPTDCLAAMLHRDMNDARRLVLGIMSRSATLSPGTAKTIVEGLPGGCRIRQDGDLVSIPTASKTKSIPFTSKGEPAVIMPWGDVATAYHTTGIPNIEVYFGMPESRIHTMRRIGNVAWLARFAVIRAVLKRVIEKRIFGPDDRERAQGEILIYGEAVDENGETLIRRMRIPEGYTFTMCAALAAVRRILEESIDPGYFTPALAFGPEFVLDIEGVQLL